MSESLDYDVIVVGGGPVGAVAANLLGQAGLRTLVLEAAFTPHPLPRAVHIDHEVMRVLQGLGLSAAMASRMREAQGHIHIGADGGVIRYMGTAGQARRFGWANDYFFFQPEFESSLREGLSRFPHVELRLGACVEAMEQTGSGVTVVVAEPRVTRHFTARYVIGCDGARSQTRKAMGVGLDDLDFEEPWLVVDAEVDDPIRFPAFSAIPPEADLQHLSVMLCDPRRPATIVPGRGNHRRWEFMLLPGEDDEAMMRPQAVEALIAPWVEGQTYRLVRAATYRFHGLVARRWRVGRVFMAGDAAHQTPPFFGQGLCHGVRDVANLVWKLKLVITGQADITLLDTYQIEREPQVRAVIGSAIAAGRYICQLDPALAAARDDQMRQASAGAPSRTPAPDLIAPYLAGALQPGGGERFIQPRVAWGQSEGLLDDLTGGGWVLLSLDAVSLESLTPRQAAVWHGLGARAFVLAPAEEATLHDPDGALTAWLAAKSARAVLLRPDAYVHGMIDTAAGLPDLIDRLADDLHLTVTNALKDTLCAS